MAWRDSKEDIIDTVNATGTAPGAVEEVIETAPADTTLPAPATTPEEVTAVGETWSNQQYIDAITTIRHGDWTAAQAAIVAIRDSIKSVQTVIDERDQRIKALMEENAKMLAQITTAQPEGLTTTPTIEEKKIESIEDIWGR